MTGDRSLRVLHVIDGLEDGGSQRLLWDLVRRTPAHEACHFVLTVYPPHPGDVYAARLQEAGAYHPAGSAPVRLATRARVWLLARGVPRRVVYVPWLIIGLCALAVRAVGAVRRFRPDAITGHTFVASAAALALGVVFSRPVVLTVPCLFSQMRDAGHGWLRDLYARLHHRVGAFTTGMPAELRAVGVPLDKITVQPPTVDMSLVGCMLTRRDVHRCRIRRDLGIPASAPVVLSVGRLHRSKGHLHGVQTVGRLSETWPDLHWIVLGEGTERPHIEARVRELGIANRVHLLGFVQDPLPYYVAADVFLRTTTFEADNQSSIQAMAAGLPVVGFDTGSGVDLIPEAGHGRRVPSGDTSAMAVEVDGLLRDRDRARRMGARGAAYARDHLDAASSRSAFMAAYRIALRYAGTHAIAPT